MFYYAIQQKSTGYFMPQPGRNRGRTHDEPIPGPPRLFTRKRDAQTALDWWIEGKHFVSFTPPGLEEDASENWYCERVPERVEMIKDLEIVEIILEVKSRYGITHGGLICR
jgi:hypothetical protein